MAAPFAAALLRYGGPHPHIVVVGPPAAEPTRALLQAALSVRTPLRTVQTLDPLTEVKRLVRDGFAAGGPPVAYVCLGATCLPPTSDPAELGRLAAGVSKKATDGRVERATRRLQTLHPSSRARRRRHAAGDGRGAGRRSPVLGDRSALHEARPARRAPQRPVTPLRQRVTAAGHVRPDRRLLSSPVVSVVIDVS